MALLAIAAAVAGCSFVDEVNVNIGDGFRLVSVNDKDLVIERDNVAADGLMYEAVLSNAKSGMPPGLEAQSTGFECSLEQSGSRSSLLSSLFSPPVKNSFAKLSCWRISEAPGEEEIRSD